uniref:LanC lantibiotic synthetase component C-like 2 (bacterial) n=1 Tax=Cyprinus carpio TaxID=7962 RepID=A0A8C2CPP5_CYPCA
MGESMSKRLKLITGAEAEMEERSFINPFPDWEQSLSASSDPEEHSGGNEPFDADGKISDAFQKKVQSKIKDLLQQMEEGLKTADPHDFSTYTGWTGIALLYLQLYRVTQEASHLQRALDYVKRTLRNLNGRRVSFLCGDAGPLAVGAVVHHHLKNQTESQECLSKLVQLQRSVLGADSDLPDELLYGRAGFLYALLYVHTEIGPDAVDHNTIIKVSVVLVYCMCVYLYRHDKYTQYTYIYYPSAKVSQDALNELLRPSVDYVRHKKFRSGNYPSSLSNETDRLVHWCHGAPGVLHMLIMAHKVFRDEKYLRDAAECGEVIWQRGLLRKGYGLCHGTAGNGYAFLSLYHATQDKKYLYRACKFAEWCLDYGTHGCRIPDRPYSLFEGMAGAIHYLSDVIQPEGSCFPAFEL